MLSMYKTQTFLLLFLMDTCKHAQRVGTRHLSDHRCQSVLRLSFIMRRVVANVHDIVIVIVVCKVRLEFLLDVFRVKRTARLLENVMTLCFLNLVLYWRWLLCLWLLFLFLFLVLVLVLVLVWLLLLLYRAVVI